MSGLINAYNRLLRLARNTEELLSRQEPSPDIMECLDNLDSIFQIAHSLREEEISITRFENGFRQDGYEANDRLDEEDEERNE